MYVVCHGNYCYALNHDVVDHSNLLKSRQFDALLSKPQVPLYFITKDHAILGRPIHHFPSLFILTLEATYLNDQYFVFTISASMISLQVLFEENGRESNPPGYIGDSSNVWQWQTAPDRRCNLNRKPDESDEYWLCNLYATHLPCAPGWDSTI